MNYVDEMFERANTQQVANFFMGSGEIVVDEKATYKERINPFPTIYQYYLV